MAEINGQPTTLMLMMMVSWALLNFANADCGEDDLHRKRVTCLDGNLDSLPVDKMDRDMKVRMVHSMCAALS